MSSTTPQPVTAVLAREPCVGCGAPLGADQRYCLSCGVPRASTRLPFLDVLAAEASNVAHPGAYLRAPAIGGAGDGAGWGGAGGGGGGPLSRHTGSFALATSLLLALLVGLLVGHWAGDSHNNSAGPSTQVIKYEGVPAAAAAQPVAPVQAAAGTAVPTTPTPTTPAAGDGTTPPSTTATTKATNPELQGLQQTTGKAHTKAVDKIVDKGKPITTGGAPPPKDNKPAGDGSGFSTIG